MVGRRHHEPGRAQGADVGPIAMATAPDVGHASAGVTLVGRATCWHWAGATGAEPPRSRQMISRTCFLPSFNNTAGRAAGAGVALIPLFGLLLKARF